MERVRGETTIINQAVRRRRIAIAVIMLIILTACCTVMFNETHLDEQTQVVPPEYVSPKLVEKIVPGMNMIQVNNILGANCYDSSSDKSYQMYNWRTMEGLIRVRVEDGVVVKAWHFAYRKTR